jgi:Cys-tRNA(Pro)/Cys-tRNA(Cys) deacylase
MQKTNAMRLLDAAKIPYTLKEYPVDESDLSGIHAAESIGLPANQVFKTLVLQGSSGNYTVCCIASSDGLDLKKVAHICKEKNIDLIAVKDLQPLTGYMRGGCSPIAMKKQFPIYIDETAILFPIVSISAGARGAVLLLNPEDLIRFTGAQTADLTE